MFVLNLQIRLNIVKQHTTYSTDIAIKFIKEDIIWDVTQD